MKTATRNISSVTKKELRGYADSATAYIAAIVFLLLWEFMFFRDAFLLGEASLRGLFGFLPWLFLLLIPAITMGAISQEKSEGTLEFLLTHPLKDRDLVIGKFLAPVAFTAIVLAFVFPLAASFSRYGDIDWGVVFGQYLASVMLASTIIALGIFISSLFKSQVSALLVTVGATFGLIILGMDLVTSRLPLSVAAVFEQLSALTHFESMARGVLDLRDIWYFLSAAVIFLALAYLQLRRRRFGNQKGLYRTVVVGVVLFIGIAVLTNLIGARIPGRVDLTQDNLYTLSEATESTVDGLEDVVTVTLYASGELPAQLQPVLRDVEDTLRDYETLGKGDLVVKQRNTTDDEEAVDDAESDGVQEIQFNVVGDNEEFEVKRGFLGLSVAYAGDTKAIPFIQNAQDLEYELTSMIADMTVDDKPTVAFATGFGAKDLNNEAQQFVAELNKQYTVTTVSLDGGAAAAQQPGVEPVEAAPADVTIPDGTTTIVLAGPTEDISDKAEEELQKFMDDGGSVLLMLDGVTVDPQSLSGTTNEGRLFTLLQDYGVQVNGDLVYDMKSNINAQFNQGGVGFLVPYPFWVRALAQEDHPISRGLEGIVMRWPSSVTTNNPNLDKAGLKATTLIKTTDAGGIQTEDFNISPQEQPATDALTEVSLGVAIGGEGEAAKDATRLAVFGDGELVTDQVAGQAPENLVMGLQAMEWLTQSASLASIQAKNKVSRQLQFDDKSESNRVKWGNMLLALLLPAAFGGWRFMRRRRLGKRTYKPLKPRGSGKKPTPPTPKKRDKTPV